jgi:hypothetical protein
LERGIGWQRKSCYSPYKSRQKFFCRRNGETPRYGKRSRLVT